MIATPSYKCLNSSGDFFSMHMVFDETQFPLKIKTSSFSIPSSVILDSVLPGSIPICTSTCPGLPTSISSPLTSRSLPPISFSL